MKYFLSNLFFVRDNYIVGRPGSPDAHMLDRVFPQFDLDQTGMIDFEAYISLCQHLNLGNRGGSLVDNFQEIDADGVGFVTLEVREER